MFFRKKCITTKMCACDRHTTFDYTHVFNNTCKKHILFQKTRLIFYDIIIFSKLHFIIKIYHISEINVRETCNIYIYIHVLMKTQNVQYITNYNYIQNIQFRIRKIHKS